MNRRNGRSSFISLIVLSGDLLFINLIFFILIFSGKFSFLSSEENFLRQIQLLLNISYLFVFYLVKEQHKQRIFELDRLVRLVFYTVTLHFMVFYILLNFMQIHFFSRKFVITFFTLEFVLVALWWVFGRIIIKIYRKKGYNYRTVIILGAGKNGVELANKMKKDDTFGYRILGYFDDNELIDSGDIPLLGKIDDVQTYLLNNSVDHIYCALPVSQGEKIMKLLDFAEKNLVRFYIIPGYYTYLKRKVDLHSFGGIPILSVLREPLENDLNRGVKRMFDILFSLFVLIFLFPFIYLFTAIAIRLSSPGPIFFKQMRTGLNGDDFACYKFRSMRVNNDSDKLQAVKNDPRKTKVGDFLRRSNLDEIPQFFNVLKGDMSVVGPRPHMLKHTEDYSALIDKYMIRHLVKPGLTGWAQINGFRGETKKLEQMESRVLHDVWYIENWSFWLDLKIILLTVFNIFRGEKNAY